MDTQRCSRCKAAKSLDAYGKDASRPNGKDAKCRSCRQAYQRELCARNVERCRAQARKNTRAYTARKGGYVPLELDGAECRICGHPGSEENRLVTDHDHRSGTTRGVLCRRCNLGLGNFLDDTSLLEAAIAYLKESEGSRYVD